MRAAIIYSFQPSSRFGSPCGLEYIAFIGLIIILIVKDGCCRRHGNGEKEKCEWRQDLKAIVTTTAKEDHAEVFLR